MGHRLFFERMGIFKRAKGITSNGNDGGGDFGIKMEHGFKGWDTDFPLVALTDFRRFCASRSFSLLGIMATRIRRMTRMNADFSLGELTDFHVNNP